MLHTLVGLIAVVVVAWLVFAVAVAVGLAVFGLEGTSGRQLVRLLPDTLRLLRDLARSGNLPRAARRRLYLAVAYNAQPINLIPDFIPVLGLVDNAVVILWALRSVVRLTNPETVACCWQGTPEALRLLFRLARLDPPPVNAIAPNHRSDPDGAPDD
jgi:uncharacterized membrane protein YkvA (DUF1232 family)